MTDLTVEREVLAAEELRCKATREGDLEALKRVLHAEYSHVTGSGSVMDREQYLEWVRATPRRHERHGLSVRCYGDAAVLLGGLTNHLTQPDGSTRTIETTVTQTAVREAGVWRFVAFHITPKR